MRQQEQPEEELVLSILGAQARPLEDGSFGVRLVTTRGPLEAKLRVAPNAPGAVIFGSVGSLETVINGGSGGSGSIYEEIEHELAAAGISALRLFFRLGHQPAPPGFDECVADMLGAVSFLKGIGVKGIALVGGSFAGGIVIRAGAISPQVTAVVAMASQLHGARYHAELIAPRPLLLLHGLDDTTLAPASSQIIYEWAGEPKELITFPQMGHNMGGPHRAELRAILLDRLVKYVGPAALAGSNGATGGAG